MMNLCKYFGSFAAVLLLLVLAGCKKDDENIVESFNLETTSLDFEYDQTKELTYSIRKARNVKVDEVPSGWQCTHSGDRFIITSPASGASSDVIKVSAIGESGVIMTRNINVAIRIAEEIASPANSFIVSESGKRYKFNALRRGNETAETITGADKAFRLWTTSTAAIVNVSLENGYVYFATGDYNVFQQGNAVIAVSDKDGNILWSWHIWAVDYDPASSHDIIGGKRVMNRNLGAMANSSSSQQNVLRSFGLYYQWGRKDPFVGPAAWNSSTQQSIFDSSGTFIVYAYEPSSAEVGTINYATLNPGTFIAGAEGSGYDWLFSKTSGSDDLWGRNGAKTIYDPCPDGWRVASPDIWKNFTATADSTDPADFNVVGGYNYGWTFEGGESDIFLPAAGRRSFSPSLATPTRNFTNVVDGGDGTGYPVGFYWSNVPDEGGSLAFRRDYINPSDADRDISETAHAGGFPLRCVEE